VALVTRTFRIARLLRRYRVDIVHAAAETCYRAVGLAGALTGTLRVCHLGFPPGPGSLAWAFRWAPDAVIGCYAGQADTLRNEILAIRHDCRVVGIVNAVDLAADAPGPAADWRFGGRHVVAMVGQLSAVKGYPTFLEAVASLRRTFEGCVFLAVGEEMTPTGYRGELEAMAARLGVSDCVRFLGWQPDVRGILSSSDVMVLPSLKEGLPLAILEAMACGRPVVATPVDGVPEAVVDGVTGFLVPPRDPEALASAVGRLLREPALAARMGAAGRTRIVEQFSRPVFAARVEQLYHDLLSARRRRRLRRASGVAAPPPAVTGVEGLA
jgi:glycosyltransferase involved in cell wall biosynthesis